MARAPRNSQHRPQRDTQKAKELADARQEVRHLKRQVQRLRKYIEKLEGTINPDLDEIEESPVAMPPPGEGFNPPVGDACPCGSQDLIQVVTPSGKKVVICSHCKLRRTL